MFDLPNLDRIASLLVSRAGGYLRNTVREPRITCHVCATPVDGYKQCIPCHKHEAEYGPRLADAVCALTYAIRGKQSAYAMLGYKAARPLKEHHAVVSLLALSGIGFHGTCAGVLAGMPVTHWATVPSLPQKQGTHPFHGIVSSALPRDAEITLLASPDVADPRTTAADHFTTAATLLPHSHVLVLDDTWAQGGHAQSTALTLRRASATKVSIMTVARWLNPGFGSNSEFVSERLSKDFDPRRCPWTGGTCPPRA
ncbi:MAG TPA: hypothetical protein VFC19_37255 [Candidatus Limnocylindrales bacterium]|nr:hypothetical protein [Candidatus Limnocylindrales bacterium]